ncbi:MAG: UDP-N-acetylmuramoyl-L-alanyl-D-glutamate--2,6-diaminopimelate ligase [Flavobacteriales bacterium]|nr:UDP-N-acetylmuramoyl-L-alanyl-D-glutamate--2,6-diaminopimelate ligase [Flavobacteriales bacterium]
MKLLKDILYRTRIDQVVGATNTAIEQIAFDSRKVVPFTAFVAIPGTRTDGHEHIADAVGRGATAVICERIPEEPAKGVTYVKVSNSAHALAIMAANFHDHPSRKLKLVGVTGTNGKTSVVTMLHRLYRALGRKTGMIGTVETRVGQRLEPSTHTTPDPIRLNELLAAMVEERCTHCFMEVSSHALVQDRVTGLEFDLAVFTNITHDHLDYHGSFADYIKAKKRLFDELSGEAMALVNADDPNSRVMVQNTKASKRSFALHELADHRARVVENQLNGLHLHIDGHDVYTRLVGAFNASNLLAVYSSAVLLGEAPLTILTALSDIAPPPGRFQLVPAKSEVMGIVDYAHTPDALKNVLATLREVCAQGERVITVVGCGGDRDRQKRPEMARIAAQNSDLVVLTSDNPRSEDPMSIIEEMRTGLSTSDATRAYVNVDRREAIRQACSLAGPGDVVLVAGKGHETYQEIHGVRHAFDDVEVLKQALELLHS